MPDNKPGFRWPIQLNIKIGPLNERHAVTLAIFLLAAGMFMMARENPELWDIELFKIILQAVVISGIIGSILAFHFSANKADEKKVENTAKAFEAVVAAASGGTNTGDAQAAADKAAEQVSGAAVDEAARIIGGE